jgi:type IV pilus assembly protein PilB
MPDEDACPHCGAPCTAEDFQCARCELLLVRNLEDLPPRDNVSLVRALISIPERVPARGIPTPPQQDKTRVYSYAPDAPVPALIPFISSGLALAERPLNPFEAYILSFVDGRTTLADLGRVTSLSEVELRAIFESLSERGITRVERVEEKKPAAAPEPRSVKPAAPAPAVPPSPAPRAAPAREPAPAVPSADPADSILQRVVHLERSGKTEEAIELLEQGISKLRSPAPLYNRLGLIVLNQQRDYGRASKLFQKAADLDPDNSIYMMNLYSVLSLKAEATHPGKKVKR